MSGLHKHYALLAEDDYAFRWALAIDLERNGFELDVAENGAEAVELRMPRVSGPELITRAATLRPDIGVVTVTAYPADAATIPTAVATTVLQKPVSVEAVRQAAAAACRVASGHHS